MPISPTLTAYPSGSGKSAAGGSTLLRRPPHLSSCLLRWQVCHITKAPVTAKFILHWEPVWVKRHVENGLKVVIYRWWVRFALALLSGCQSPTWLVEDCNGKAEERASSSDARGRSSACSGACRLAHFAARWGIQTGHGYFPLGAW